MHIFTCLLFGISGDLAKRKLIPALYHLYVQESAMKMLIIGVAHYEYTVKEILQSALPFVEDVDLKKWQNFEQLFLFSVADISSYDSMNELAQKVSGWEKQYGFVNANRLIYLAISGHLFEVATDLLAQTKLCVKRDSEDAIWHRIVYEKPFGKSSASARAINKVIAAHFSESQIYRVDHYLTKDMIGNIILARFANTIFQPLWSANHIERVHITLHETMGIEGRGLYYDEYGALADVVQNHMLQMAALIAMETPASLSGEAMRNARVAVLQQISCADGVLGQYTGYMNEMAVAKNSKTETYVLLKCIIDNDRWRGVPFFISTGKMLDKAYVGVSIKFKPAECLLTQGCPVESNWLHFDLSPHARFRLQLNAKSVSSSDVTPIELLFCQTSAFKSRASQAYESLLLEVLQGSHTSVVRADEIEASWHIVEKFKQQNLPLYEYIQGSAGPDEALKKEQQWLLQKEQI